MDTFNFRDVSHPVNRYIRYWIQFMIAASFPFVLIALANILVWIVNNPFLFICMWGIVLAIGIFADAVIEFDYHFGFPVGMNHEQSQGGHDHAHYLQLAIWPEFDEAETDSDEDPNAEEVNEEFGQVVVFFDAIEPPPGEFPMEMGLAGQGENYGDVVPPTPSPAAASRPRKQRTHLSTNARPEVKAALDGANIPPDESETDTETDDESVDSFTVRLLDKTASNSQQDLDSTAAKNEE